MSDKHTNIEDTAEQHEASHATHDASQDHGITDNNVAKDSEVSPETAKVMDENATEHGIDEEHADSKAASEAQKATSADTVNVQTRVKRVGLAALILSLGILCSRLLGFVREAVIAYQAGAGAATDAYNAAFTLPDLMNYFLAGGTMSITFIPLFAAYMAQDKPERANRLFSLIATTMGSILTLAIVICMIFTKPLAHLLFPGFSPEQLANTVEMTRIVLPGQIFHYIGSLMMACLMARGQFVPSALAPLIYNLMIIVGGVVLYPVIGMKGFSVGALVGAFLGPFLIPCFYLKGKVAYRPEISFTDPDFKKYILLTLPLMLGVSLTTVDEWIGRYIGSAMEEGSISWLNYARRLVLVPIAIVGQAAGQAALPYLSQLSAKGEFDKAADTLHKTLHNVILLSFVMIGFFFVLAEPMVALVYERGAFSAADTATTASVMRILCISILFWTIQMVSVRAFYAAQDTLRPMIMTTCVTAISLPIYWFLSREFGLMGLAMASVIGMCLQATSIVLFYRRRNAFFKPFWLLRSAGMGVLLFGATAGGAYAGLKIAKAISVFSTPTLSALWTLAIAGTMGVLAVGILACVIMPQTLKAFIHKVLRKLHLR
ncbi:MAG: murein biosynthesis integral membrane protein MurJ [Proteobacteria bacterium]|nr:murein biosynthesis integral membrane protein MurJ [Pseudomonadota bacterium]